MRHATRWTRRSAMRGAVAAGTFGVGWALLGAQGAAAGLTRASTVIDLTFAPWWIYWNPTGRRLLNEATQNFDATHTGLRLTAVEGPQGGSVTTGEIITAALGGQGPDVIGDCCEALVTYVSAGVFADLSPFLQRDNIPLTTWNTGHVAALQEAGGQYGLPLYDGPVVYMYNKTILDQLGLSYPDPEWDYHAAASLFRQATGTIATGPNKGSHRYGACFWWYPGYYTPGHWLFKGFGGSVMDATHTRCLIDQPGAVAAGEWIEPQIWNKSATPNFNYSDIQNGLTVFSPRGGWYIARDVTNFGTKFEWDYVPVPKFPDGRATFGNNDYWGMNNLSKHREAAWEVLKWVTYEDYWQRFTMKTAMLGPAKVSLWDEFEALLTSVAPILRTKQIRWYKDAVQKGYGYAQEFFRYQAGQAFTIINNVMGDLNNRKIDVIGAFSQIANQVNALEATGPRLAAAEAAQMSAVQTYVAKAERSSGPIAFPVPPRLGPGQGVAPTDTTWVTSGANGSVTVRAQGIGVEGSTDGGTFAGSAFHMSQGEFTCRLVSVSLPKGGDLHQYKTAKVGLMARASLGDGAPAVSLDFTAYRGVHLAVRQILGVSSSGTGPSSSTAATGLFGQSTVQVASKPAAGGNWLVKPIWLRWQVRNNVWTAYTSLDGKSWSAAGSPSTVEFVGAWVGLFATSANPGQFIQAAFDNATGFAPSTRVVIGKP